MEKVCLAVYTNISPIYYLPVTVRIEFGLLPSDVIWRYRLGRHRIRCYLTAPCHYSNQCWLHKSEEISLRGVWIGMAHWRLDTLNHVQDGRLCSPWYSWMRIVFRFIFLRVCSWESNWWYNSISSDNGLMTIKWQAFTWTNDDLVHRHHGYHARMN